MTDATLEEIVAQALRLSPAEQALLLEQLAAALHQTLTVSSVHDETDDWTDEEWAEMFKPKPLPPSEVIARGLTGTWSNIADGAEWVNEQKRKREIQRQWKFQQRS
jgi:hypothetical protein